MAWQKAMDLAVAIYQKTHGFPKEEVYGLTSQLRRAAVSVPSNIAEGTADRTVHQFSNFLSNAIGSLNEIDTQLDLVPIRKTLPKVCLRAKIPPPAASRLSAPFVKGGSEGAAERGICRVRRSKRMRSYSDRLLALRLGYLAEQDYRRLYEVPDECLALTYGLRKSLIAKNEKR
jgi:four helix bundle protein